MKLSGNQAVSVLPTLTSLWHLLLSLEQIIEFHSIKKTHPVSLRIFSTSH